MKRSLPQSLFDAATKKEKLESQRIGNFIVKAPEAIIFKIGNSEHFFSPLFTHQVFEDEKIKGYEGLSLELTLSPKFLVPLLRVSYEKKAPAFAPIDDVEQVLRDHYGKLYTDAAKFQTEVLDKEKHLPRFGSKLAEVTCKQGKKFAVHKVCMNEETFCDWQFSLQCALTFFIDAASKLEISRYWHYFLLYDEETGDLAGFTCCYEAFRSAEEFRTKLALIFIFPTFQQRGLGSKLYDVTYHHYKDQPRCYQLIVEDASDDFQAVQDLVNCKVLLEHAHDLKATLAASNNYLCKPEQVQDALAFDIQNIHKLASSLKLPEQTVLRLIDLIVYSCLEGATSNPSVHAAFRRLVKKRLYIRCMKVYAELFRGKKQVLLQRRAKADSVKTPTTWTPLVWNGYMEDDPLCLQGLPEEEPQDDFLTNEGIKVQLKQMFEAMSSDFDKLKAKVKLAI